jgi:hypothetical protein
MCQVNSKRMHQVYTKCYRVYNEAGDSYYNGFILPAIGVNTPALDKRPFHAFRQKKDVETWLAFGTDKCRKEFPNPRRMFNVFECVLTKKLKSGKWEDSTHYGIIIKTCTGNVLTVVRQVGSYHPFNGHIEWTA